MSHKKIIGVASAGLILSISAILGFGMDSFIDTESQTKYNKGYLPTDTSLLGLLKIPPSENFQDAVTKTDYALKSPSYLPKGYNVEKIVADGNKQYVWILASQYPITQETMYQEFLWDQQGILIYIEPLPEEMTKQSYLSTFVERHSKESSRTTDVDGRDAVLYDIYESKDLEGNTIHSPANLVVIDGDYKISITGFLSSEELTKIAETL